MAVAPPKPVSTGKWKNGVDDEHIWLIRPVEPLFFFNLIVYGMYILYLSVAFVRTDRITNVRGMRLPN